MATIHRPEHPEMPYGYTRQYWTRDTYLRSVRGSLYDVMQIMPRHSDFRDAIDRCAWKLDILEYLKGITPQPYRVMNHSSQATDYLRMHSTVSLMDVQRALNTIWLDTKNPHRMMAILQSVHDMLAEIVRSEQAVIDIHNW